MFPLLLDGDIVYCKQVSFSKIKTDDIVCIKQRNKLVTHRVIYKAKKYIITKGDGNMLSDGKIEPMCIAGLVYAVERDGQKFNIENFYLFQSSIYFEEIKKVMRIFQKEKIYFLILKGLPLHLFLIEKHPRRIYADCDVLIRKSQINRVDQIFSKLRYQSKDPFEQRFRGDKPKEYPETTYWKEISGVIVRFDIHREAVFVATAVGIFNQLYPIKYVDEFTAELFLSSRTVLVHGVLFPILSQETLIAYLLLHLFHHNYEGANRYELIDYLLRNQSKTDTVVEIALKYKIEGFIAPALHFLDIYYFNKNASRILSECKLDSIKKNYVGKLGSKDIFSETVYTGDNFKNTFFLSDERMLKKITVFLNFDVIFSIIQRIIYKKMTKSK